MRHEVEILEAQEFAYEYYNISREEFIEKASIQYPTHHPEGGLLPSFQRQAYLFRVAVEAYDEIQTDMMEIA